MRGVRESILDLVHRFPGIHGRLIERVLGLSENLSLYHLERLEREGLILRVKDGRYVRCVDREFLQSSPPVGIDSVLLLSNPSLRSIVEVLLREGESSPSSIGRRVGRSRPTLTHHLRRLVEREVVVPRRVGRSKLFRLKDPKRTRIALERIPPLPASAFETVWEDLYG